MFRDPFTLAKTKKRLIHAKYSEKVPVTMSANESAVLETFLPQQKKKTTVIYAKNTDASCTQQVSDINGKKYLPFQ